MGWRKSKGFFKWLIIGYLPVKLAVARAVLLKL